MSKPYGDDFDDRNTRKKMVVYCVLAASLIMLAFLWILYQNNEERHKRIAAQVKEQEKELQELKAAQDEMTELGVGQNNLRSEDLDFWDMYTPTRTPEPEPTAGVRAAVTPVPRRREEPALVEEEVNERAEDDLPEEEPDDEKHIKVTDPEGKTVYYEIMDEVAKNRYTLATDLSMKNARLSYNDGDLIAQTGIAVSKAQGVIDWAKVKADGINFAMVKVAYRGYETGIISLDDNFVLNARGAAANGIAVGTYFSTQAVSETEAIEEANFTVGAIAQYGITYPVAIYIEKIKNDTARTEKLTMSERTDYVKKYLETVKSFGFTPVIYADRNTLICDLDLSKLTDYSIFLSDPVDFDAAKMSGFSTEPEPKNVPTPVPSPKPTYYYGTSSSTGGTTGKAAPIPSSASSGVYSVNTGFYAAANNTASRVSGNTIRNQGADNAGDNGKEPVTPPASETEPWYTDFPYRFTIWQYDPTGSVNGITGSVPMLLGFLDYTKR
ncbi:MAG: hypothetical protein IJT16_02825 [Lachnospiraceae bacterium]|nr:hypothetical protein [Lachnospiraceae bacterium]